MDEFNQTQYSKGYAWAASLIDTYGVKLVREMRSQCGEPGSDYELGFKTCLGVAIERELSG